METEVKNNIKHFGEQMNAILANISRFRQKINNHLEKLEDDFRNEVQKIEDNTSRRMQDTLQMFNNKNSERLKYQQQLQDMKKHASDLQTYLGLRQISSKIAKLESSLQSVIENGSLDKYSFVCSINDSLNDITSSIHTFGTTAGEKTLTHITYIRQKYKQAQIVGVSPKSVHDIKVKIRQKFEMNLEEIRGCDIFPDNRMVFSDYCNKVIVITDTNGEH